MHISEGVLSAPVLLGGGALAAAGTAVGMRRLDYDRIAQVGLLSAAFFVASLVHVPVGPANAHLVLNGLVGLLLGWPAVPAILVALALQGTFFQFGGITTLGVNTVIMGLPAVAAHLLCGPWLGRGPRAAAAAAFAAGALGVLLSGVLAALALVFTEAHFTKVAALIVAVHLPVMAVEGVITALCVGFLRRVKPEMLPAAARAGGQAAEEGQR